MSEKNVQGVGGFRRHTSHSRFILAGIPTQKYGRSHGRDYWNIPFNIRFVQRTGKNHHGTNATAVNHTHVSLCESICVRMITRILRVQIGLKVATAHSAS